MTYTQAKQKIEAARRLTSTSNFKLERGYIYASSIETYAVRTANNLKGFINLPRPRNWNKKYIWGINSKSILVRV
jgi:hypothetical protein